MVVELPFSKLARINWLMVCFTLLVFSALIKLGFWQSARAVEKDLRQQRITELGNSQPLSLTKIIALQESDENINDLPVSLNGEFVKDIIFLLDNQFDNGRLGYRVLQVVKSDEIHVLVNLGWVQGAIDRHKLPDIRAISGRFNVQGNIRKVEVGIQLKPQQFSDITWPLRIQQIELDKLSVLLEINLQPYVVYVGSNQELGYQKNWQPIVMPAEKHRAYAFQWFSLAIAWLSLMLWAARKMSKNNT